METYGLVLRKPSRCVTNTSVYNSRQTQQ